MAELIIPPAGLSEAGTWAPTEVDGPYRPVAFLADRVDPRTREITRLAAGDHPIDAAVLFALQAVAGKAPAVEKAGTGLDALRKITRTTDRAVEYEIEFALRHLVKRGSIRIDKIAVGSTAQLLGASDMAAALVVYTNLQTGRSERAQVIR